MILRDRSIRAAMSRLEDPLVVDPPFPPERLQPASLELTLHPEVLMHEAAWVSMHSDGGSSLNEARWRSQTLTDPYQGLLLGPGGFWLASTVETVQIPTDLVAVVNGKSSLARLGLSIHQTGGFIDPGFRGQVTLELVNSGKDHIRLKPGQPICQLVFMQMDGPADRPYGSTGLGSHYMGQRGPTPSRA